MATARMTTVAIVEDNAVIRRTLEELVNEAPGFRCVCACGTAEEALKALPRHAPDVVLMDIHLPNRSGIECTAELKQALPQVQVMMLTVYEEAEMIFKALKAGASGYLLKRSRPEQIIAAINEIRSGGAPMTSEIARKVVASFQEPVAANSKMENLSRRELEILELLSQGFANKDIAQKLSLSVETVRVHLRHIYDKFHVRSRMQAVLKFIDARSQGESPAMPGH